MYWSSGLKEFNFSGLKNITSIGKWCFANSNKIQKIDLSFLPNFKHVGEGFGYDCPQLIEVNIGSTDAYSFDRSPYTLAHKSSFHRGYGVGTLIKGENKEAFVQLFTILKESESYRYLLTEKINFVTLTNGNRYELAENASINQFAVSDGLHCNLSLKDGQTMTVSVKDISNISIRNGNTSVQSIGDNFLNGAENLNNILFDNMSSVITVGKCFLKHCYNLQSFDFGDFKNLQSMQGNDLFRDCSSIMSLDFSVLNHGETFQITNKSNPFVNCYNLLAINFGKVKASNISGDPMHAFSIRNMVTSFGYLIGCAITGEDQAAIINKFSPEFTIIDTEDADAMELVIDTGKCIVESLAIFHDYTEMTMHMLIVGRNIRYPNALDDIIDLIIQ